jgi:hypothetical protein
VNLNRSLVLDNRKAMSLEKCAAELFSIVLSILFPDAFQKWPFR